MSSFLRLVSSPDVPFSPSLPLDEVPKSKRWSTPGSVGRKKGARSSAFGASFGLLRCCKVWIKGQHSAMRSDIVKAHLDGLEVEQRLPARSRHQGQRQQLLGELIRRRIRLHIVPVDGRLHFLQCIVGVQPLNRRQRHVLEILLDERAQRHLGELSAVGPEVDADRVDVRGGEEVGRGGEGERGGNRRGAEGVDELAGRDVKGTNDRILRGGDDPARVGREGLEGRTRVSKRSSTADGNARLTTSRIWPREPYSSRTTRRVSMSTILTLRSSQVTARRLFSR